MTTTQTTACRCSDSLDWPAALREVRSHRGASLQQLSAEAPTLVIFLRHTGCVFCREALADLSRQRAAIEAMGVRIALVHMSEPLSATLRFERYALGDIHRFGDRACRLYRAFGLERGRFRQLFGLRVFWRGLLATVRGNGLGRLEGDGLRLAGVFLLYQGRALIEYRAATAADRPDYLRIARLGCAEIEALGGRPSVSPAAARRPA